MVLVFASNNKHKLEEVRAMMPAGIEVLSLKDIGFEAEIEETGETLEENSKIKAEAVATFIHDEMSAAKPLNGDAALNGEKKIDGVFADDTGLEIDALGGKPGVYTARWYLRSHPSDTRNESVVTTDSRALRSPQELTVSGTPLSEQEIFGANRKKALRELEGKEERGAQFRTVITLIKGSESIQVEGIVRGEIAKEEYGEGGFGYDPVFIPEGHDKTFGELPAEVKNHISHRARALAELVKVLQKE